MRKISRHFCFVSRETDLESFFFVGTKSINGNNSIDFRVFFSSLHTELCVNFVNRKFLRLVGAFEFLVNERLTRNLSVFFAVFPTPFRH